MLVGGGAPSAEFCGCFDAVDFFERPDPMCLDSRDLIEGERECVCVWGSDKTNKSCQVRKVL